jgi:hypothetical protein
MTDKTDLERLADLAGRQSASRRPSASLVTPDVRSGATFPFRGADNADDPIPGYLVTWIYTVPVGSRQDFAKAVRDYEDEFGDEIPSANDSQLEPGDLAYRGTFAVSVSSGAPEFEYRTFWGLHTLAHLQTLNDVMADTSRTKLQAILKLIDRDRPMRAEIMGRAKYTIE